MFQTSHLSLFFFFSLSAPFSSPHASLALDPGASFSRLPSYFGPLSLSLCGWLRVLSDQSADTSFHISCPLLGPYSIHLWDFLLPLYPSHSCSVRVLRPSVLFGLPSLRLSIPTFSFSVSSFVTFQDFLSKCPLFFPPLWASPSPPPPSGFLWSPIARQVLYSVAEPVLDDDAVHRGLGHPQLLPDGPLWLAVLPEVHHSLPLHHIMLLGLLASSGWPSGGSPRSSPDGPSSGGGFCGGRQAADCSGDSERGAG